MGGGKLDFEGVFGEIAARILIQEFLSFFVASLVGMTVAIDFVEWSGFSGGEDSWRDHAAFEL